ncbi:MAG: hypothetical protein H6712_30680 [Myxococcales bacterium]|nr:hypothetical protein [Myxococcales bacterium]
MTIVSAACPSPEDANDDGIVETSHLRITTTEDEPICKGTGPFLQRELERISATLELPLWSPDDKLEVRLGFGAVEELCSAHDPDVINGCADLDGKAIASKGVLYSTPHELAHAVRIWNGPLVPRMFEEGLAEILSGSDGYPWYVQFPRGMGWPTPAELLAVPPEEFDLTEYIPSQSFLSWLWLTYGRDQLMALANDPRLADGDPATLFEEHYGFSLADANQGWVDEDGPDPVWGAPCLPEQTFTLDGVFEIDGVLDCADPEVIGATISMSAPPMCLVVPQNTRTRITFEADHGYLSIVEREGCDPGPTSAEATRDKFLDAGETIEQDIAGCRYRMVLASQEPGFPPTEWSIRIEEIAG